MIRNLAQHLPSSFVDRIIELHAERGRVWLENLSLLLERAESRWSIKVQGRIDPLTYNFVALAEGLHGEKWVLKAGVPDRELSTEIEALRIYAGEGMVRLIDADADKGLLLLERLIPGKPLADLKDDEATTSIACGIMRRLRQPAPEEHAFPAVEDWAKGFGRLRTEFDGGTGPFDQELVGLAETLSSELTSSTKERVLLHGDLHHANILSAEREPWLALDPKGVVGEPEYEVGAFLRNPTPAIAKDPEIDQLLSRRLDQFSDELAFDRDRILGWGLVQAVLSAWWSYEDHSHGWEPAMFIAERLRKQMNT